MFNSSEVSIIMSFVAGFLTFLSPCILPLFPSYITYISGIISIPTTFIIDREGRIRERYLGYRDKEIFEEAIKGLI